MAFQNFPSRRRAMIRLAAGAALPCSFAAPVFAQTWPAKPIKYIVPVAPGGGSDLIGRQVAERLGRALGQSIVVENIAGGGGVIACQTAMRAAPDGYTLLQSYVATHSTAPATRKVPYHPLNDFSPVGMIGGTPNVLVVPANLPVADFKEFIAYAKKNVGKLSYGSAGPGSLTHLAMEQLKQSQGFFAVHIPYRGIAPAINDMFAGSTQAMMPGLAAALPHIQAGKLKAIAVTGRKRHAALPNVPTLEEQGLKGFDAVQWYGIVGPAKMPPEIIARLSSELQKVITTPEFRQRLSAEAVEPMPMDPALFSAYMAADFGRYAKLARERGISLDS